MRLSVCMNLFRERRCDFKDRIALLFIRFAACCVLALAGCSDSRGPEASDESGTPTVMPSEAPEPPIPREAVVLTHQILQDEDDALLVDMARRDELAHEIGHVLSRIREAYPDVADITARERYASGVLLIGLEPELFTIVSALLEDQTGPVVLHTGYAEFDSLNEQLGLSEVVEVFPSSGIVTLYFNDYLNVPAAAATYATLEGVEFAEPNAYVGDGSDIDAAQSEGRWYVVVRRAWGDCPAGCTNEELYFFIVNETEVERIDHAPAMERAEFRELVTNRRW